MRIAITGATGFLGPYLVRHLTQRGHVCRCWYRPASARSGLSSLPQNQLEWVIGELGNETATRTLVAGCDAVVHAALYRHGVRFTGGEGDVVDFVRANVVGTLQLVEAARAAGVPRFVFISTCAVHDVILDDRPLDEAHPLWPKSHYGAHKAALEKFVHAYGFGAGYDICALRPTGIFGLADPPEESRWFDLVRAVAHGQEVTCTGGGKEVHASDVARAVEILLEADGIAGQAYNCYDRYISEYEVAELARKLSGSAARIRGQPGRPKHQIVTDKLRALGMTFGGQALFESTIQQMVAAVRGT